MKKFIPLLFLVGFGLPAKADLTHKLSSSVQLSVNAAATQVDRVGSTFTISGSNIDTTDGTTAGTVSAGTITSGVYNPGTIAATQDTAGAAFSFSSSYIQADAVPTSAPTVGAVGNFSSQVSTASGAKDTLAGTITSAGVITVTAGGAGTVATGQFVNELTIN